MSHEQLWAPWRLAYIKREAEPDVAPSPASLLPGADPQCFLCRDAVEEPNEKNLIVQRGAHCITVLNRFPYNNGHLLVAPLKHKARLADLTAAEHLEAMQTVSHWVDAIERLMNAEGFNVGLNLGRVAGAGLPGHLHWHIVPRWNGDTNFMPVLASVDVIPQSLECLWTLLRESGLPANGE